MVGRRRVVRPLPTGCTLSWVNTLLAKPASEATSIKYQKGRTLVLVALSSMSVTGCVSFRMRLPSRGSTGLGALMLTPGSGPAIVGLNGFSVLVNVQLAAATAHAMTKLPETTLIMEKVEPKVHKPA